MKLTTSLAAAVLVSAAFSPALAAQNLYSNSITNPGSMTIALKLRLASSNITIPVSVSATSNLTVVAPANVTTDANGYGSAIVEVSGAGTFAPEAFTVTLTHPSLPGGALTKDYLIQGVGGELTSAWPEFLQIQGAFCLNMSNQNGAAHLQVDRTLDLDGDGFYGDNIIENNANGIDDLDFPAEFSMDVNGMGVNGCVGGNPVGTFWPADTLGPRTSAFLVDNRIANTSTCDYTTRMNFLQDMDFVASFNGAPAVFLTGTSTDNVLICRDSNADGNIDDSEITTFMDPMTLINAENYSPDGIAVDPTTPNVLYWITDTFTGGPATNQGLFRMADMNSDDVIGVGEIIPSWTGGITGVVVEGHTVVVAEAMEGLHVDSAGGVLVNLTDIGTIFRWVDGNGNGVAETGEVSNWLTYNVSGSSPLATTSADFPGFAGGMFPGGGLTFRMNLITSVVAGGTDIYYLAADDSGSTSGTAAGLIFRCEDKNGDGDVNDLDEVTVLNDGTQGFLTGMDATTVDVNGNGTIERTEIFVYGTFPNGPVPGCGFPFADQNNWRFNDADDDGDAQDAGDESQRICIHPTGAFNRGLELIPSALNGGFDLGFQNISTLVTVAQPNCVGSAGTLEVDMRADKIEEGPNGTPFAGNQRVVLRSRGNINAGVPNSGFLLGIKGPISVPLNGCAFWLTSGAPVFVLGIPAMPDANGVVEQAVPVPSGLAGILHVQPFTTNLLVVTLGEVAEWRLF